MCFVAKHKRHVEYIDIWHHRANGSERGTQDIDGTDLGLLNHFFLAAEHTPGEHGELVLAVGSGFKFFTQTLNGNDIGVTSGVYVGSFKHNLR